MDSTEKDDVQTSIDSVSPSANPLIFIADNVNSGWRASAKRGARKKEPGGYHPVDGFLVGTTCGTE